MWTWRWALVGSHSLSHSHCLSHSAPVPNIPYGFCGCKAPPWKNFIFRAQGLCEHGGGLWWVLIPYPILIAYPILHPSLIYHTVSVDVRHHHERILFLELRGCVNMEVGFGGFSFLIPFFPPSQINHMVSVDVKHHSERKRKEISFRDQEPCEQGVSGLSFPVPFCPSVPNKPYGLCGRKAIGEEMNKEEGVPLG